MANCTLNCTELHVEQQQLLEFVVVCYCRKGVEIFHFILILFFSCVVVKRQRDARRANCRRETRTQPRNTALLVLSPAAAAAAATTTTAATTIATTTTARHARLRVQQKHD